MKQKQTVENYLKTVYILSKRREVHGAHIAEELNVSRPTVSICLKALEEEGYLFLDDMRAVHLTETGRAIAEETYERHMIFQKLLEELGVDAKTAAADACRLEHAVSSESFAALKKLMEERNQYRKEAAENNDD